MPHGVLFRGGAEKEIRRGLLEDDLLEAVIGLAPNLFYGTGIPACILVLRAIGAKPPERRGKVLFINADAEFSAGRAQNYLLPEHIEKIVSAYYDFTDIPGYATVVTHEKLLDNDVNLNIRRYADNAPPPEPQDVRAHLVGGIPKREVADKSDLFDAHGFDPMHIFIERDADYYDFDASVASKSDLPSLVDDDPGVVAREAELATAFDAWWEANAKFIIELPETRALMAARATLLDSFVTALTPVGLLDRFQVAGAIASWWGDIQFDLRTLAAGGFPAVVDGWVTTITTAFDEKKVKGDPLDHPLVRMLLSEYLVEIEDATAKRAEREGRIKGANSQNDAEDDDTAQDADDEESLSPAELATLKKDLSAAKKKLKALEQAFVVKLTEARGQLSAEDVQDLVLRATRNGLTDHLDTYASTHRRLVVAALENWWDKYAESMEALEERANTTRTALTSFEKALGYV
jgi:type I restriction enzyme M protein